MMSQRKTTPDPNLCPPTQLLPKPIFAVSYYYRTQVKVALVSCRWLLHPPWSKKINAMKSDFIHPRSQVGNQQWIQSPFKRSRAALGYPSHCEIMRHADRTRTSIDPDLLR